MRGRLTFAAVVLAGLLLPASAAANSILNGDFETGNFSDWIVDPASTGSALFVGGHGHSGVGAAWFGAISGHDDWLSQTFATLPGESYVVTFWLAHGATDHANDFNVWWNSTSLLNLINAPKFGQTSYSFVTTASGDETTLRFSGRELRDYYYLDSVSVAPLPTPEPTTVALLVGGLAALAGRARAGRKKRDGSRAA